VTAPTSSRPSERLPFQGDPHLLQQLSLTFLGFGAIVRLVQYFSNRSMWFDEVSLVLNLQSRSYGELLTLLDYNQAAPPLFLWAEKFLMQILGSHEYVLRLIPLVAGLASLYLFYRFALRFSSGLVTPLAIALFASLEYVVYYCAEVKPYILDLTLGLLLFLMLTPLHGAFLSWQTRLQLMLIGAVSIWLVYPIVFIMASTELVNFGRSPLRKWKDLLLNRLPMYAAWLLSFAVLYIWIIQPTLGNDALVESWGTRYPDSLLDIWWILDAVGRFFYNPMGFLGYADGLAIAVFLVGCIHLYRHDRLRLVIVGTPLLITLASAYLQQYPFRERLVLFLVPYALLILTEGIVALLTLGRSRTPLVPIAGMVIAVLLIVPPVDRSIQRITDPNAFFYDHVRPVVGYIHDHWQAGDRLYVFHEAERQFLFYGAKVGFAPEDYVLGKRELPDFDEWSGDALQKYHRDIAPLLGRSRVWLLLARKSAPNQAALLTDLSQFGTQLDVYTQPDALGCLYDLR
jgi:hypothetical protein